MRPAPLGGSRYFKCSSRLAHEPSGTYFSAKERLEPLHKREFVCLRLQPGLKTQGLRVNKVTLCDGRVPHPGHSTRRHCHGDRCLWTAMPARRQLNEQRQFLREQNERARLTLAVDLLSR